MKEFKLIKKKLTKYSFEILRNIELICFIKPCLINDYSKFLKKQFKKEEETKLYNYLNNNWLKKDPIIFNYYNLLNSNDKPSFFKEHLYLTNNIAECLHSKLNYYLPKRKINANDFLYGISNILNLNDIKTNQILRKDIITKTLFKISSNIKDKNFKWLTYDTFKIVEHDIFILDTGLSEFNEVNNNLASINNIANKEDALNDKESFFITEDTNDILNIDENDISEDYSVDITEDLDSIIKDSLEDKERCKMGLLDRLLTKKILMIMKIL